MKCIPLAAILTATFAVAPRSFSQQRETAWIESPSRPGTFLARFAWSGKDYSEWKNSFALDIGGVPASFETQDEELLLGTQLLPNTGSSDFFTFIGLTRSDSSSPWTWETGLPLSYSLNMSSTSYSDTKIVAHQLNGIRHYYGENHSSPWKRCLIEVSNFVDCDGDGEHDLVQLYYNKSGLDWDNDGTIDTCEEQGTVYCGSSNPNSTGQLGGIRALGRTQVVNNDMILYATDLPPGKFGYWLASLSTDDLPGFGGSMGTLCLGAPQIRFNMHPKYGVWSVPSNGRVGTVLDLTDIPQVGSIKAGETWHFQAWHRDLVGGNLTSNTTDALMITFV